MLDREKRLHKKRVEKTHALLLPFLITVINIQKPPSTAAL